MEFDDKLGDDAKVGAVATDGKEDADWRGRVATRLAHRGSGGDRWWWEQSKSVLSDVFPVVRGGWREVYLKKW